MSAAQFSVIGAFRDAVIAFRDAVIAYRDRQRFGAMPSDALT